jgi:LysM repeat protein
VRRTIPSPLILSIWLALLSSLSAQTGNPAVAEDAEMERRKILKAADQVDRVDQQVDQIQSRVTALEQLLADLRQQSQSLKESLANAAAKSSHERTALLEEVSKMLAERKEREKAKATEKAAAVTKPVEKEGYEHTVAKGDTLSSIAQAYNSEYQLKLTSETIRQANQLAKNAPLKVGQKLIVPSK